MDGNLTLTLTPDIELTFWGQNCDSERRKNRPCMPIDESDVLFFILLAVVFLLKRDDLSKMLRIFSRVFIFRVSTCDAIS